ncbi:MAG: NUDIX hydrolase [bacterium]|nr:NUDIX hydrolase [bacterium]
MIKKNTIQVNVSVNCIIERDGEFLLVQQARPAVVYGTWSFPGGKVDEGESFREAAIREAMEETGLVCADTQYIGVKHEYPKETVKHFFAVTVKNGNITVPGGELLDARWFTLDQIRAMKNKLRKPWVLDTLEEYNQRKTITNNPRLGD